MVDTYLFVYLFWVNTSRGTKVRWCKANECLFPPISVSSAGQSVYLLINKPLWKWPGMAADVCNSITSTSTPRRPEKKHFPLKYCIFSCSHRNLNWTKSEFHNPQIIQLTFLTGYINMRIPDINILTLIPQHWLGSTHQLLPQRSDKVFTSITSRLEAVGYLA